jgi:hypothetical protein
VLIGRGAGFACSLADNVVAAGANVARDATDVQDCVVVGREAGAGANEGSNVVACGYGAGRSTTDATDCVFLGRQAGENCKYANGVIAGGRGAAALVVYAEDTVMLGSNAGANTIVLADCIFVGRDAGNSLRRGVNVVALGAGAGRGVRELGNCVMIGASAGGTTNNREGCVVVGHGSTAESNTVSLGFRTGNDNAENGVFVGAGAGRDAVGNGVVCLGANAFAYGAGDESVCVGRYAGQFSKGNTNVFIGKFSGARTYGNNNMFVGNRIRTNNAANTVAVQNMVVIGSNIAVADTLVGSLTNGIVIGSDMELDESYDNAVVVSTPATGEVIRADGNVTRLGGAQTVVSGDLRVEGAFAPGVAPGPRVTQGARGPPGTTHPITFEAMAGAGSRAFAGTLHVHASDDDQKNGVLTGCVIRNRGAGDPAVVEVTSTYTSPAMDVLGLASAGVGGAGLVVTTDPGCRVCWTLVGGVSTA